MKLQTNTRYNRIKVLFFFFKRLLCNGPYNNSCVDFTFNLYSKTWKVSFDSENYAYTFFVKNKYTCPVLLKTVKLNKTKKSLRKCHSQAESKEILQVNEMEYLQWDIGIEKGYWVKTEKNMNKTWTLGKNNVPIYWSLIVRNVLY